MGPLTLGDQDHLVTHAGIDLSVQRGSRLNGVAQWHMPRTRPQTRDPRLVRERGMRLEHTNKAFP